MFQQSHLVLLVSVQNVVQVFQVFVDLVWIQHFALDVVVVAEVERTDLLLLRLVSFCAQVFLLRLELLKAHSWQIPRSHTVRNLLLLLSEHGFVLFDFYLQIALCKQTVHLTRIWIASAASSTKRTTY